MSGERRVLYLSSNGNLFGGAELCLLDIVRGMRGLGWVPLVVVPFEGGLAETLRHEGVEVAVIDMGTLRHRGEIRSPVLLFRLATSVFATLRLYRLVRRRRIDLVHSNSAVVFSGALAALMARKPHIWHVREIPAGPLWALVRRLILGASTAAVCISEAVALHLVGADRDRPGLVRVLPDGVDTATFAPSPVPAEPPLLVGMVGRLHPHKGHRLFLRAAALVAGRGTPARFMVVGNVLPQYTELEAELHRLSVDLGLRETLEWVHHADRPELAKLLRAMAIVVMPSTWPEGGGLVVLEAMASGRPVVATRHGGPVEVVEDGVTGFLVSPSSPDEMAAAIESLLRDPARAAAVGQRAAARVEGHYSLSRHLASLDALYREVIPGA